MKNLLQKLLLLITLFISANTFSQTLKYHRITAKITPSEFQIIMNDGLEADHFDYKNNVFIAEVSDNDINIFKSNRIKFKYILKDVEKNILSYNKKIDRKAAKVLKNAGIQNEAARSTATPTNFGLGSMGGYFTYTEMVTILDNMRTKFPNLISVKSNLGNTGQGRALWMVKISDNPDVDENEPRISMNALHHAREPISLSQLLYFMWYIMENYNSDKEIKSLLNSSEIYFIPCVNPDGYVYNQTTNPSGGGMWRKNRRQNSDGSYGVDNNRNYSYKWGFDNSGSSPTGSSETYRGTAGFSELENIAMRNFYNQKNIKTVFNYHTAGNHLLHPNCWEATNTNPEKTFFTTLGNFLSLENGFGVGTDYTQLGYVANGNALDWQYYEQTTKAKTYSFTPEVGTSSDGFWPASSRIIPLCNSTIDMNLKLIRVSTYHGLATQNGARTFTSPLSGAVNFSFQNFSYTPASYTVSLTPITTGVTSVTSPKIISGLAMLATQQNVFNFTVDSATPANKIFQFALKVDNGLSPITDTVSVTYTLPDTQAPTAPGNLTAAGTTSTSTNLSWAASTDNIGVTGYNVYRGTTLLATVTSPAYAVTGLSANTTYTFYVTAKDASGNISASSNVVTVTTSAATATYCTSKSNNVAYMYIGKVQIGTINNSSSGNAGYGNFTALSTNLVRGAATSFTITPAWPKTTKYSCAYSIWIDYNNDGDFLDSGEQVFLKAKSTTSPITGSFTVPAATSLGAKRMRISQKYNANPTSCETFSYGEVEDYTVNISLTASRGIQTDPINTITSNAIKVFPNPAIGDHLNLSNVKSGENYRILDMSMQLIQTGIIRDSKIEISNIENGNYILEILNSSGKVTTKFFRGK